MIHKPSQCPHPNLSEEGGELYCADCNSYFTRAEIKKLDEVECEHCGAVLVVDEICFCRGIVMTIEFVNGDLLDALDKGEVDVIGHVVNCQGVMGGGLAKSIRERYPSVYEEYRLRYEGTKSGDQCLLGRAQECWVKQSPLWSNSVFNLHAQLGFGTHKRQLNYGALGKCLFDMEQDTKGATVGFPYLLGCGLAGGSWEIVLEIIEYYFKDHSVKIYKL